MFWKISFTITQNKTQSHVNKPQIHRSYYHSLFAIDFWNYFFDFILYGV